MENQNFIEFFLRVMNEKYFKSKRKMAAVLGIEHRTLLYLILNFFRPFELTSDVL